MEEGHPQEMKESQQKCLQCATAFSQPSWNSMSLALPENLKKKKDTKEKLFLGQAPQISSNNLEIIYLFIVGYILFVKKSRVYCKMLAHKC